ncbi:MAG: hypothetical protein R2761_31780, partial [Acidimicrobiales bacterium]
WRAVSERRSRRKLSASLRPLAPLAVVWLLGSLTLALLVAQRRIPMEELLLDPNAYGGVHWYTGLVSNLGVLGWTVAAAGGAAGAWISGAGHRAGAVRFLRGGCLYTGLLLLDDLFQLHIVVSRAVGLPKSAFYCMYLALGLWWGLGGRAELARTRWPLLLAGVGALSVSVVVDQLVPPSPRALLAEDSSKFLGILAWALYFCLTARDIASSVVAGATRARPDRDSPGTDPSSRHEPAPTPDSSPAPLGAGAGR